MTTEKCVLVDIVASSFFSKPHLVLNAGESVVKCWAEIAKALANAGSIVKGRIILAPSIIMDYEQVDIKALEKLAEFGVISTKVVDPPKRPKVKSVSSVVQPTRVAPVDGFISFDSLKHFEQFWESYPARQGQKLRKTDARNWYTSYIQSETEAKRLQEAVTIYKRSPSVASGFVKDAINFLPDWQTWLEFQPTQVNTSRVSQANINRADDDRLVL